MNNTQSALVTAVVTVNMSTIDGQVFEPDGVIQEQEKPKAYSNNRRLDDVLKEINARHEYKRLVSMSEGEIAQMSYKDQMARVARLEEFAKAQRPKHVAKPMSPKAQARLTQQQAIAKAKKEAQAAQGRNGAKKAK